MNVGKVKNLDVMSVKLYIEKPIIKYVVESITWRMENESK